MEWLKLFLDLTKEQDTQEQLNSLIQKHNALADVFGRVLIGFIALMVLVLGLGLLVAWQQHRIEKVEKRLRVLPAIEALTKSLKESLESKESKGLTAEP